jgi:tRNA pseudouridine13 synthase
MSRPAAVFKRTPEDFVVDEIDAYPASGEGPHTFVRVRKRGLTTDAALTRLASALGVDRRACGSAGLKDKDAVTTQRISLPNVDPAAAMALAGTWEDLEVLEAARHANKLKPGHLRGNRFAIRLRDLSNDAVADVARALERIGVEGCPNAFGPQRFGRDGDNPRRALAFVRGEERPPRDARERRFLFSALQSRWFNRLLEARVADGTWKVPQLGDVLKKHETGGMFVCADVETDRARAAAGEVSPTGPIFGAKMQRPGDAVFARELAVLVDDGIDESHLIAHHALGEGTRRVLRLMVESMSVVDEGPSGSLLVCMTLPKGAYATTVLEQVVELRRDARVAPEQAAGDEAAASTETTE